MIIEPWFINGSQGPVIYLCTSSAMCYSNLVRFRPEVFNDVHITFFKGIITHTIVESLICSPISLWPPFLGLYLWPLGGSRTQLCQITCLILSYHISSQIRKAFSHKLLCVKPGHSLKCSWPDREVNQGPLLSRMMPDCFTPQSCRMQAQPQQQDVKCSIVAVIVMSLIILYVLGHCRMQFYVWRLSFASTSLHYLLLLVHDFLPDPGSIVITHNTNNSFVSIVKI